MMGDPKLKEWHLLKDQFDALVRDQTDRAGSIEELFDAEFRRRFCELILQTARHSSQENVLEFPRGRY